MPKPKQIVKSKAVLDSVAHLPRDHLGHGIYQTTLESGDPPSSKHWGNTQRGFASTPHPLPRFEGKENCTFTVRVPRVHLTALSREEITSRRALWGTDIYSDDSDIIAACIHSGWVRGEWSQDIDVSLLGLEPDSPEADRNGVAVNGVTQANEEGRDAANGKGKKDILLNKPPSRGPMMPLTDCDLHVTVLILPALEKYSSTTRFGIMSRAWQATHDGLSFKILGIKWVHGVDTAREATGEERRMRMRLTLPSLETDEEAFWGSVLENGDGSNIDYGSRNGLARESFVRSDGTGPLAELSGLGMGSWWKGRDKRKSKSIEKEVEVKVEERAAEEVAQGEAMVVG
jgi:phenolic acid decarboxylase